jgi:hypothetical protein
MHFREVAAACCHSELYGAHSAEYRFEQKGTGESTKLSESLRFVEHSLWRSRKFAFVCASWLIYVC